jgi:nucleoside 2-deoxyribosyltransferase
MNIYLAGPMRGYPNLNFRAFDTAAYTLRREGHYVFSPAENDREKYGINPDDYPTGLEEPKTDVRKLLFDDLEYICKHADAIALLPEWHLSRGTAAEIATATALGLKIITL